jgi:hypothetical protein
MIFFVLLINYQTMKKKAAWILVVEQKVNP